MLETGMWSPDRPKTESSTELADQFDRFETSFRIYCNQLDHREHDPRTLGTPQHLLAGHAEEVQQSTPDLTTRLPTMPSPASEDLVDAILDPLSRLFPLQVLEHLHQFTVQ
ncbi:MAG: hypothetical protein GEU79_06795 [Acidimicrobiia bacterium]|nr:hypothetical protein [Acidimicrobiia bacterium]